eukprot:10651679-Prorocentrum_lima.AAC.1
MSPANWELLCQIAAFLRGYQVPFILGGDWNMDPRALEETGWPDTIDGTIVAANCATCVSAQA